MKNIWKLGAASALAFGLAATAQAGMTPQQVAALMQSKGLQVTDTQYSPDGAVAVTVGRDSTGWGWAMTLVDVDKNGVGDFLIMGSIVEGAASVPLQKLNTYNSTSLYKAFTAQGSAALADTALIVGNTDYGNVSSNFDLFRAEFASYRDMVAPYASGANSFGVSLEVKQDPYILDKGMTRIEVKARDAELAAKLNQTRGSHEEFADEASFSDLIKVSMEYGRVNFSAY
ncbi:hypothetical protein HK107_06235 [Parvularcula sp. ZS-1/3]|uniref:Uncharacterized protein n=1 Tax=Parvularcula mediterranea TaxID=2732508 RepID=A0A7Y3W4M7_9PROT|nr:hypothetical protein [Parvularcula mediterranea]NNU15920.1 hypothetical protein [Parvularcula mediterranea]